MDIKILFGGDTMVARSFNEYFNRDPQLNIWGDTKNLTSDSDLFIVNLETTITDSNNKFPNKVFNFKLATKYGYVLRENNINYVNLANNHALDYQKEGMIDTIKSLNSLGIKYTGVGINPIDAMKPALFNIKGVKIGIVSATDHPENFSFEYMKDYGVYFIDLAKGEWDKDVRYISGLKHNASFDILIFSMHHGSNYVQKIPDNTRLFFRQLIDNGVDIIHGHSAHHILPIEFYKTGIIFYSMGDFIDDYAIDRYFRNDLAFIGELNISEGKIKLNVHPTKITTTGRYSKVNLIKRDDPDYNYVIDKLNLKQNGGYYHSKYSKYKRKYIRLRRTWDKI